MMYYAWKNARLGIIDHIHSCSTCCSLDFLFSGVKISRFICKFAGYDIGWYIFWAMIC